MKELTFETIKVKSDNETVWLTQKQIAGMYGVTIDNISKHIKNILDRQELDRDSVIEKYYITESDGKSYNTEHYNLDMILSLGYRINSKVATKFRQWATETLKEKILGSEVKQLPQTYSEALRELADSWDKNEQLTTENKERAKALEKAQPAIEFTEQVHNSYNTITIRDFAKLMNTGQKRLFQLLRDKAYLNQNNTPRPGYLDSGVFEIIEKTFNTPFGIKTYTQTLISPKGQTYLYNKLFNKKEGKEDGK
jgi:phage antirepressor YoqD-like protein